MLPTPVPPLYGDATCDNIINSNDALLLLQFAAALLAAKPCPVASDVNLDGFINALDAALVLQYVVGLIPTLPPPGVAGSGEVIQVSPWSLKLAGLW